MVADPLPSLVVSSHEGIGGKLRVCSHSCADAFYSQSKKTGFSRVVLMGVLDNWPGLLAGGVWPVLGG